MFRKIITVAVLAVGAGLVTAGPVLAGGDVSPNNGLPAPGVLALVAVGVIAAIALARSRK